MTPERLKECLKILGTNQSAFGRSTGWGESAVKNWAKGAYKVPEEKASWIEKVVRWRERNPPPS